jgi:hypothetical protein
MQGDLFPKEVLKSVESMLCAGESRAKQIADRVLVPVPEALSRECAFKVPVALSSAAWEECVEWAEVSTHEALWNVLFAALGAIRSKDRKSDSADFEVQRVASGEASCSRVGMKVVVGPGDQREPVLTIYLTGEV